MGKITVRMITMLTWLPEEFLRLLHLKHERHFFAFRKPSLLILLLLLQVVASNLQTRYRSKYCSFCHSFSNGGPTSTAWQPDFLVLIRHRPVFEFQEKKQQRICSNFLATLRCTFHLLKTISQVLVFLEVFLFCFLLLRLARFSSGNYRKSLIYVTIAEKIRRNGKIWQILTNFRHCQLTVRQDVLVFLKLDSLCIFNWKSYS